MLVEVQLIQVILQGGGFAVVVMFCVWIVQRGVPMIRDIVENQRKEFMAEMAKADERHTVELDSKRAEFLAALAAIEARHTAENEECRKERREQAKQVREDREADRAARHALAASFQQAITEMFRRLPDRPSTLNEKG